MIYRYNRSCFWWYYNSKSSLAYQIKKRLNLNTKKWSHSIVVSTIVWILGVNISLSWVNDIGQPLFTKVAPFIFQSSFHFIHLNFCWSVIVYSWSWRVGDNAEVWNEGIKWASLDNLALPCGSFYLIFC